MTTSINIKNQLRIGWISQAQSFARTLTSNNPNTWVDIDWVICCIVEGPGRDQHRFLVKHNHYAKCACCGETDYTSDMLQVDDNYLCSYCTYVEPDPPYSCVVCGDGYWNRNVDGVCDSWDCANAINDLVEAAQAREIERCIDSQYAVHDDHI